MTAAQGGGIQSEKVIFKITFTIAFFSRNYLAITSFIAITFHFGTT